MVDCASLSFIETNVSIIPLPIDWGEAPIRYGVKTSSVTGQTAKAVFVYNTEKHKAETTAILFTLNLLILITILPLTYYLPYYLTN